MIIVLLWADKKKLGGVLVSLAVLPCFMYFIAMIIVLLWANK